MKIDIINISAT